MPSRESDPKRLVIYHASCTDGFTAAWCAWLKYGEEAEYMSAQYGDEPPDVTGKDVLIVDFSYPRGALLKMNEQAKSLLVLDHHKTAAEALAGLDFAVFDMKRSGAGMTWDTLHPLHMRPDLVDYVEDRDLWLWKQESSREVSAYVSSFAFDFEVWNQLRIRLAADHNSCVAQGASILRAQDRIVTSQVKLAGRATIGGWRVPFINCTMFQSELIGELAEHDKFACGWFQRSDGMFVYSLRSRGDFDVSAIAKQYDGGGHKNAAGFTLDYLIETSAP